MIDLNTLMNKNYSVPVVQSQQQIRQHPECASLNPEIQVFIPLFSCCLGKLTTNLIICFNRLLTTNKTQKQYILIAMIATVQINNTAVPTSKPVIRPLSTWLSQKDPLLLAANTDRIKSETKNIPSGIMIGKMVRITPQKPPDRKSKHCTRDVSLLQNIVCDLIVG